MHSFKKHKMTLHINHLVKWTNRSIRTAVTELVLCVCAIFSMVAWHWQWLETSFVHSYRSSRSMSSNWSAMSWLNTGRQVVMSLGGLCVWGGVGGWMGVCGCVGVMFLGLRRCTEIKLLDKVSQQMGFFVKMWEHVLQMHVSLATILRVICQKKKMARKFWSFLIFGSSTESNHTSLHSDD